MAGKAHVRAEKPLSRPAAQSGTEAMLDVTAVTLAAAVAFWPVLGNQFVNWDDPDVIMRNVRLGAPGVVAWAFSTTLIGHYQPLAWIAWSVTKAMAGLSPTAFHALSLAVHLVNGGLVYVLTRRMGDAAGLPGSAGRIAALTASLTYVLHPLRVEPVAWASAAPYVLSVTPLLLAVLAYVHGWRTLSLVCYGVALLVRPSAVTFPVVLFLIDRYPLQRNRRATLRRLATEKTPFAVLAVGATVAEAWAREAASLSDVPVGARITMAATSPFVYLARTVLPFRLTPLDALPISPSTNWGALMIGAAGLVVVTAAAWAVRRRRPAVLTVWLAFLVLVAPVAGLTPSGVQATADRYMYVPGIVLSIALGAAVAQAFALNPAWIGRTLAVAGLVVFTAFAAATWRQTQYWHDSISLWKRVIELDPRNDVATYNLAIALAEAGREDEAMTWYERTLQLVPNHDFARQNLALLQAARAEREGNRLADSGRLDEASDQYARALALDGKRLHSRAAYGMVLMRRGHFREAATELRTAIDGGSKDAEVANALAFSLVQLGDSAGAIGVLRAAIADHPDNVNLQRNLAGVEAGERRPRRELTR